MIKLDALNIEYVIPMAFFVVGMLSGYLLGNTAHETECAQEIIDLADCRMKYKERGDELIKCRAEGAGGAVIDCAPICAKQVREALKNAQAWNCEN